MPKDPDQLLDEILKDKKANTTWRKKIKWWWQYRCLQCGGALVFGEVTPRGWQLFFKPQCEWCVKLDIPRHQRIYRKRKMNWRWVSIGLFLLLVLILSLQALKKIKVEEKRRPLPPAEIRESKILMDY